MPVIIFEGPKMNKEQKEQLVQEFSAAASKITNIPQEKFITLIKENNPEDVGVGAELLVNMQKR
ncbi:MAG: 4-oxalocrotonate tautomerase [Peptococcaceae bacterium BRH_c4b]|nr:MAG: 4-oxalocrotonate tautomerase [Peptococcaceae bacterium BRH_c4b]